MTKNNKKKTIEIYFDGCTGKKNPGHIGIGCVIIDGDKKKGYYEYAGDGRTNNEAEYAALYLALVWGIDTGIYEHRVKIYGDSKLVVNQINGVWKTKKKRLKNLQDKVMGLLNLYEDWTLEWVSRDENNLADMMSRKGLEDKGIDPF